MLSFAAKTQTQRETNEGSVRQTDKKLVCVEVWNQFNKSYTARQTSNYQIIYSCNESGMLDMNSVLQVN
jgi:hypothetical protein